MSQREPTPGAELAPKTMKVSDLREELAARQLSPKGKCLLEFYFYVHLTLSIESIMAVIYHHHTTFRRVRSLHKYIKVLKMCSFLCIFYLFSFFCHH